MICFDFYFMEEKVKQNCYYKIESNYNISLIILVCLNNRGLQLHLQVVKVYCICPQTHLFKVYIPDIPPTSQNLQRGERIWLLKHEQVANRANSCESKTWFVAEKLTEIIPVSRIVTFSWKSKVIISFVLLKLIFRYFILSIMWCYLKLFAFLSSHTLCPHFHFYSLHSNPISQSRLFRDR